ncbi:MAG: substrate-binding domain-containing protein, partial [Pseudomonadota bacterium]
KSSNPTTDNEFGGVWPRLTTARTPARRIGRLAAERLFDIDAESTPQGENQTIPRLIERDSTRRPNES